MKKYQRTAIIGSCGAGKSTFARQLGKIIGIEVIHLDKHYWKPGWVRSSKQQWEARQKQLMSKEAWIIDGNYRSSFHIRFPVADTIIFFDFPKWLCLWRAIRRRFQYHNKSREDLGGINKERISWEYLRWIMMYPRKETLEKLNIYKDSKNIIVFKKPRDVRKFLNAIKSKRPGQGING